MTTARDSPPACDRWLGPADHAYCGTTTGVRHYLVGPRCPHHTPAALAGHLEAPDPKPHETAGRGGAQPGTAPTTTIRRTL